MSCSFDQSVSRSHNTHINGKSTVLRLAFLSIRLVSFACTINGQLGNAETREQKWKHRNLLVLLRFPEVKGYMQLASKKSHQLYSDAVG